MLILTFFVLSFQLEEIGSSREEQNQLRDNSGILQSEEDHLTDYPAANNEGNEPYAALQSATALSGSSGAFSAALGGSDGEISNDDADVPAADAPLRTDGRSADAHIAADAPRAEGGADAAQRAKMTAINNLAGNFRGFRLFSGAQLSALHRAEQYGAEGRRSSDERGSAPPKRAKFAILSIFPDTVSPNGNEKITIRTNMTQASIVFCRINAKVLHARYLSNGEIVCRTPVLHPGEARVSVSVDKRKWCDDFTLHVGKDYDGERAWFVICIAIVFILFISYMVFKFMFFKRKVPKRKNFRNANDPLLRLNRSHNDTASLKRRRAQIEP